MREIKKKYFEENPEAGKEHSEKMKKRFEENPNLGKEHGERVKKYYEDNPEAKRKLIDGKGKNKPFNIFTNDGAFVKTFTYQFEAKEYLRKEHNINSTIKMKFYAEEEKVLLDLYLNINENLICIVFL